MKFYTSNYANIAKLKEKNPNYIFVSISGDIPDYLKEIVDIWDRRLAPNWDLFREYKNSVEGQDREDIYVKRFKEEVLLKSDINEIFKSWSDVYGLNEKYVLLCYESNNPSESTFCHRRIVGEAIGEKYGIEVPELNFDYDTYKIEDYKVKLNTEEIDIGEW